MKYCELNGIIYHCDNIFNYAAIDRNGSVMFYENKPFVRDCMYYWTSGHTNSYDYRIYVKNQGDYPNWRQSMVKLTS